MLNGKGTIIHLIVGLTKKTLYKNESTPLSHKENVKLKLTFLIMQQKKYQ